MTLNRIRKVFIHIFNSNLVISKEYKNLGKWDGNGFSENTQGGFVHYIIGKRSVGM